MSAVRPAAVAGTFYPAAAAELRRDVERYAASAAPPLDARGIVAPHAGYLYSGGVAGSVYGRVRLPRCFVLLGPNHTGRGAPLALAPDGDWATPLGRARVDRELSSALARACPLLAVDAAAHRTEHSLEVQIPFLQVLAPGARFAAVCVGTSQPVALDALGRALARVVAAWSEPVLLVASSDMNHYEAAAVGAAKDRLAIDRILALDAGGLHRVVDAHEISMCGFAPTIAVLTACREVGASGARLLRYAHSGEVSGDNDRVVGYAAIVIA
jgi:AmmeMemoRadiSam system protein B